MSQTLHLVDHILNRARTYQRHGLYVKAMHLLQRIARLGDLSPEVAEETQRRLGEIQLRRRQFVQARRHLAAALTYRPGCAHYLHLMARAIVGDRKSDPAQADPYFRRCVKAAPTNPRYLCDFGLHALRLGLRAEGLRALGQAYELGADDPNLVAKLVKGLRQQGEMEEAETKVRLARFRHPKDARFQQLWLDCQFQLLWAQQQTDKPEAAVPSSDEPTLLPFVDPAASQPGRTIRRDAPAKPNSAHLSHQARLSNRKKA